MRFIKYIFIIPVFVYSQVSYLNISVFDESEIFVAFDNLYLAEPGNYAELDQVSPGEHSLKIVKHDASMSAMGSVLFEGKIKIPAGTDIYAVIDEYNSLLIYKKVKYGFNRCNCVSDSRKKCGEKPGEKSEFPVIKTDECKYKVMSAENFKDLKSDINNKTFESTNITIVKTAIDKNMFSSEQVKEILSYFTFEDSKLEVAKYAYQKVCDKNNFFKVYSAFYFDSSIEELKNYISGK
jgi:hypothetical protein